MMSHLHGQAVHLVRRRAAELERDLAERTERAARDRARHEADLRGRDIRIASLEATITQLRAANRREACPRPTPCGTGNAATREREARRIAAQRALIGARDAAIAMRDARITELTQRLALLTDFAPASPGAPAAAPRAPDDTMNGTSRCVGYIGGRTGLMPRLRAIAAESGIALEHHDGGMEDNFHGIERLVVQADCLMCPIDCVSHSACRVAKELCRKYGKPFIPLRNASGTCFGRALDAHLGGVAAPL
jgi:hypothetical protein